MLADLYAAGPKRVIAWAMAIEMIHTYSLIHDDLPCMDNDDWRRGQLTNHKVYGETVALLAGDALLTQAFHHIATQYENEPALAIQLVKLLSSASGAFGMVGGQTVDINFHKLQFLNSEEKIQTLKKLHEMKTGALIQVAIEGAALICGLESSVISFWRQLGAQLGLAFQVKDDLLDAQEKIESQSYPGILGIQKTSSFLAEITDEMLAGLHAQGFANSKISDLVYFNLQREK